MGQHLSPLLKMSVLCILPAVRRKASQVPRSPAIRAAFHNCACTLPCRLAYPMPPAGADPDTWVPEEEPQPIGITVSLPQGSILPGDSQLSA